MVRTDLATSLPEGHFDTGVKSSALFARADSILGVIRDAAGGVLTHALSTWRPIFIYLAPHLFLIHPIALVLES